MTQLLTADQISHHWSRGLYGKEMRIKAGQQLDRHFHVYDHFGVLARGTAALTIAGERRVIHAPMLLNIREGEAHDLTAITDTTWYCIHATDETDVAKVDGTLIVGEV